MGNHRTDKRRLFRLQKSINQEARILELQVALHAAQQVGQHVPAPDHIQQQQEVNEAPMPVEPMDTEIPTPFPIASAVQDVYQRSSVPESSIEDTKLTHNVEAPAANANSALFLLPGTCSHGRTVLHDTEQTEVIHLETIPCSTSDVDTHTLSDNFLGAGAQEPTKPYTICTGIWVLKKDHSLARSGITIW